MKFLANLFALSLILSSCNETNTDKNKVDEGTQNKDTNNLKSDNKKVQRDFSKFKINIYDSDLLFDVNIEKIEIDTIKNHFEIPSDKKYKEPTFEDGYALKVFFSFTNPYNEKYVKVPLDYSFKLFGGEDGKEFQNYSNSEFSIEARKGRGKFYYWDYIKAANGMKVLYGRGGYENDFEPNQTQHYMVEFKPFGKEIKTVLLEGFSKENKKYGVTTYIIKIDVPSRKILDLQYEVVEN